MPEPREAAPPENLLKCAVWMTLSALAFSLMALVAKLSARDFPESLLFFFRSAVMLVFVSFTLVASRTSPATSEWKRVLLRSLAGSAAIYFYMHTLARIDISRAILLLNLAPLFVVLISWIFIGERITWKIFFWMMVAFGGVALVTDPFHEKDGASMLGILFGLTSSACAAIAYTTLRSMGTRVRSEVIVFYFSVIATLLATPAAIGPLRSMVLPWDAYLRLGSIGFFGFLGQVTMTNGYRHASATKASSFGLLGIVFTTLWGLLFLGEELIPLRVVGSALILLGVFFVGYEKPTKKAVV